MTTKLEDARAALIGAVRMYAPTPAILSDTALATLKLCMDNLQDAAVEAAMDEGPGADGAVPTAEFNPPVVDGTLPPTSDSKSKGHASASDMKAEPLPLPPPVPAHVTPIPETTFVTGETGELQKFENGARVR